MSNIDPLTPFDCDLRDFAFMPLDVVRLRDSDMAATESAEVFRAAVLLWCASWHQVPAGSIPNDDRVLSSLSGYGRVIKEWQKVKVGALRGWIECSDGRLYHKVVCEKALESHESKLRHSYSKMGERLRKLNKSRTEKGLNSIAQPTYLDWISGGMLEPIPPEIQQPSGGSSECSAGFPAGKVLKGEVREHKGQVREILKPSVPNGTGSEPPKLTDPEDIIFGYGVTMLVSAGIPDKQARSFLGGLRKGHGDDALIDKLRECAKAKPLQPVEWLAAALPPGGSKRRTLAPENFAAKDYGSGVNPL